MDWYLKQFGLCFAARSKITAETSSRYEKLSVQHAQGASAGFTPVAWSPRYLRRASKSRKDALSSAHRARGLWWYCAYQNRMIQKSITLVMIDQKESCLISVLVNGEKTSSRFMGVSRGKPAHANLESHVLCSRALQKNLIEEEWMMLRPQNSSRNKGFPLVLTEFLPRISKIRNYY